MKKNKEKQRIKIKLGKVPIGEDFYWDDFMGFGGWVIEHPNNRFTLIMDSGDDGNTYTKRKIPSNTKVYIEINEGEENE